MTTCRLHLVLPDDEEIPADAEEIAHRRSELRDTFDDMFGLADGPRIQDTSDEWVSETFSESSDTFQRIPEFEDEILDRFPDGDVLTTRQQREVMDPGDYEYDDVIMLQLTYAIT